MCLELFVHFLICFTDLWSPPTPTPPPYDTVFVFGFLNFFWYQRLNLPACACQKCAYTTKLNPWPATVFTTVALYDFKSGIVMPTALPLLPRIILAFKVFLIPIEGLWRKRNSTTVAGSADWCNCGNQC